MYRVFKACVQHVIIGIKMHGIMGAALTAVMMVNFRLEFLQMDRAKGNRSGSRRFEPKKRYDEKTRGVEGPRSAWTSRC